MEPVERLPPPCTLWRCFRSIKTKRSRSCTRVVMTLGIETNSPLCRGCGFRSVPFQWTGHPFPELSKYHWVGCTGTAVIDLLCVSPVLSSNRGFRRLMQGTARGSICGAFLGIPTSSVTDMTLKVTDWREHLCYFCNPHSLKEGTETSRPVATVAVPPLSGRVTGLAP